MDAGVAALVGAAVGSVTAIVVGALQDRSQEKIRKEQARAELTNERLRQYVELLTTAREIRYAALRTFQKRATRPTGEVDQILTGMSKAYYLIAITSPADTAKLAWTLRQKAFDLWRQAQDEPGSDRATWLAAVRGVRAEVERFRIHVTAELGIAPDEPREPFEAE